MILVADSATERSIALRSRPAGNGFLRLALRRAGRRVAHHVADHVADVHHADRIVERLVVGDEARMAGAFEHLDQVAERDVALHRDDVGARHHDVVDPAPAQRQDVGEHDALLRREAALAERVRSPARSAGRRAAMSSSRTRRAARARASYRRSRAAAPGRLRHHGGQVHAFGGAASAVNRCDLARLCQAWRVDVRPLIACVEIRIRHAEPRQDDALELLHRLRLRLRFVIVAHQVEKSMHRRDAPDDRRTACPRPALRARWSRTRWRCRRAISTSPAPPGAGGNDSTLVGLSMPRHCALSRRTAASSVSSTRDGVVP